MNHWEILIFFAMIAFIYSSVGFGGGSSYLAILALYDLPFQEIRLTALFCNIIVVAGGTLVFISHHNMRWKKILPLVLFSVPMAFLGARLRIGEDTFFILLGFSLIIAGVLLWIRTRPGEVFPLGKVRYMQDGVLGGGIGFLSGMVGIGGGIFLSPVLNLMKWDRPREIAATASFYILVNSMAGVAGQLSRLPPHLNFLRILLLVGAVFVGGQFGSRMGAVRFNPLVIRRVTACLVFGAGMEVLFRHLPWFK